MTTPLPEPRNNQPEDHAAISRRFIAQARKELEQGERLQASEKTWGAAAHAIKAVAAQRGWRHDHHGLLMAAATQLAFEFDRPELSTMMDVAESLHGNFYSNQRDEGGILLAIESTEHLIRGLDEVRAAPPRPFTVSNGGDQNRLQGLLRRAVPLHAHSPTGFARPE